MVITLFMPHQVMSRLRLKNTVSFRTLTLFLFVLGCLAFGKIYRAAGRVPNRTDLPASRYKEGERKKIYFNLSRLWYSWICGLCRKEKGCSEIPFLRPLTKWLKVMRLCEELCLARSLLRRLMPKKMKKKKTDRIENNLTFANWTLYSTLTFLSQHTSNSPFNLRCHVWFLTTTLPLQ